MHKLDPIARAIGTDPDLYKLACNCLDTSRSLDDAALQFVSTLLGAGITKTPDGHRFSIDTVRSALATI
jgi:hypothetical protein